MSGMTLKQMARYEFRDACEEYRKALMASDREAIVRSSVRVHSTKGHVPKVMWSLPGRIRREVEAARASL